jgi:hypothetical protein
MANEQDSLADGYAAVGDKESVRGAIESAIAVAPTDTSLDLAARSSFLSEENAKLCAEGAILAFSRGLSRPEEATLTTCGKELAAARRPTLADARRRLCEGHARSRCLSIPRSPGICPIPTKFAVGNHIFWNRLN